MTAPAHTPRPWTRDRLYPSDAERLIARVYGSYADDEHYIIGPRQPNTEEEAQANGDLLAAAPALLAACRVLVLTPGIKAHLEATDSKAPAQARAAIARAEGAKNPSGT
jgi:hypothetical protein